MIKQVLAIYLQVRDAERKQKQLDKMKASPLNYGILRELINSAVHGVDIEVKLIDGTTLTIKPEVKVMKMPVYGESF